MKHKFKTTSHGKQVMMIPHNVTITIEGVESYAYARHIENIMDIYDADLEFIERVLNERLDNDLNLTDSINCQRLIEKIRKI
jgi:hypothetical protein